MPENSKTFVICTVFWIKKKILQNFFFCTVLFVLFCFVFFCFCFFFFVLDMIDLCNRCKILSFHSSLQLVFCLVHIG